MKRLLNLNGWSKMKCLKVSGERSIVNILYTLTERTEIVSFSSQHNFNINIYLSMLNELPSDSQIVINNCVFNNYIISK